MYGWLILLIVMVIVFIGAIILDKRNRNTEYENYSWDLVKLTFIIVIMLGVVNAVSFIKGKEFCIELKKQFDLIDNPSYCSTDKVMKINQAIYEVRNSKKVWGNWSKYYYIPDELLVPVSLNDNN